MNWHTDKPSNWRLWSSMNETFPIQVLLSESQRQAPTLIDSNAGFSLQRRNIGELEADSRLPRTKIFASSSAVTKAPPTRDARFAVALTAIAHEVTQPLSGIIVNFELCIRKLRRNADALAATERALRVADRAIALTAQLRELFAQKPAKRADCSISIEWSASRIHVGNRYSSLSDRSEV